VCRVARLRWCGEFISDVHKVFTERPHDLGVAIASHYDLIVGRMSASASLRISPRMAATFCTGMPRSKPIQRVPSMKG